LVVILLLFPAVADGPITIHYNGYTEGSKIGTPQTLEVDMVIGADGANSRVAKEIDAGEYDYAIAFQERIRIPGVCSMDRMEFFNRWGLILMQL
jgi:geranylgeranyl reductase